MGAVKSAQVSTGELISMLGISRSRLSELTREGVIPKAARGRYPLSAVTEYCERMRAVAAGQGAPGNQAELTQARARLARARADGIAFQNEKLRETLIDAAEAERAWDQVLAAVRARMMQIPGEIARALPHLSAHDVEVITRVIRDALDETLCPVSLRSDEPAVPRTLPTMN